MTTTGKAAFTVNDKTYETWYTITGQIRESKNRPLVAVHGGPGMTHDYMLPNTKLFELAGIPVILYDQLGNGNSSHVDDAHPSFWTVDLFMDELENLVQHLGISNDYDLLGNSWGGMLAGNFAAARQPKGLKHLIIANAPASTPQFYIGLNNLLDSFSEEDKAIVHRCEAEGTLNAPDYQRVVGDFRKKHLCNMDPWPQELMASFAASDACPAVGNAMLGPYVFTVVGNLKDWSIVEILHNIQVPTLLISSPFDTVQENAYSPWFREIPKIKWVEIIESTHLTQFEAPAHYLSAVISFLSSPL
ncbi:proline-specific peptidase [Gymnopus androsaceus JB14]|uniref:Proline-specific peptidase n=1 Tax=Gymnopus androsaceus JB14 TaxID=1447944 RepID=A0A6A4HRZ4_9AGAR|nr:proline-specific peptidase [Gymnopus androsaceus JB14]